MTDLPKHIVGAEHYDALCDKFAAAVEEYGPLHATVIIGACITILGQTLTKAPSQSKREQLAEQMLETMKGLIDHIDREMGSTEQHH